MVAAAILIAFPWSPVAYAARRLQRAGVPYIVDAGDPWLLTSPKTDTRLLGKLRSRRAESSIWSGADGDGGDVFSRLLYAGRISLTIGLGVSLMASAVGILIGTLVADLITPLIDPRVRLR